MYEHLLSIWIVYILLTTFFIWSFENLLSKLADTASFSFFNGEDSFKEVN